MRRLGLIIGIALCAVSAQADEARKRCLESVADGESASPSRPNDQLFLADSQCDAVAKRELRLQLFEIPQDGEDAMSLSVAAKNRGGLLRFKIPFSF